MKIQQLFRSMLGFRTSELSARFNSIELYLMSLLVATLMVACGGGGGVSGGGTGGSVPVPVSGSAGPINGLGSIIVAGIEFDDPINQIVAEDGAKISSQNLTLGVQVIVLGESPSLKPNETNRVQSIVIQRRYMGILNVAEINGKTRLSINGQRILTDRRSIVVGRNAAADFVGQKVLVSGYLEPFRNDIIATRIELAPVSIPAERIYVTGKVQSVDTSAKLASIGFTTVSYAKATSSDTAIQAGDIIRFEGTAVSGSTTGVIASRWNNVSARAALGEVTLRGVVSSRPTVASPNSPLIVDGYTVLITPAAVAKLTDLRLGSAVEVKGKLDQTNILNPGLRIIGNAIDPLPGETAVPDPVPQPGSDPFNDYLIKRAVVESVDQASNSYVLRGIRVKMPRNAPLPPEVFVGNLISVEGQVQQDAAGLYLEAVITQSGLQWQTPQQITQGYAVQDVLINSAGQARVLWIDANTANLQSSLYEPSSGGWTMQPTVSLGTSEVEDTNLGLYLQPSLGLSDGRAMLVYAAAKCLFAKPIGVATSQWKASQQVSIDCAGTVISPRVALDATGNAILAWTDLRAGSYRIYVSQYESATQLWSLPVAISPPSASYIEASVARNEAGQAVVAWSDQLALSFASIYKNGVWGAGTQVSAAALRGNIVMDSVGNITLVASYPNRIVAVQYSAANSTWSAEEDSFANSNGGALLRSLIAMDASGNVVVVWKSETTRTLYSRQFNASNGVWSSITAIATSTDFINPSALAVNAYGQAILGYVKSEGQAIQRFAARYNFNNNTWSAQGAPADAPPSDMRNKVAINNNGESVMIWLQRDTANVWRSFANVLR
jgi:Domain of unknown function (DUF5666)